jgi:hypothetical protein
MKLQSIDLYRMIIAFFKIMRMLVPISYRAPSQRLLVAVIVALVALVTGCAVTFGYRHADWLIRWQLDHYLDLNSGQRRDVTARLQPLLLRHRTEVIPQYEQFLRELQQRLGRGLTHEDLDWIYASYDRFRADLFERLAPDGGVVLTAITEKQIRNFEEVVQKEEQKAARRLQKPLSVRLDERARTALSLAEDWLGPLSAEQTSRIRQWSLALPDTQPVWWEYRRHRHQELVALMRHQQSPSETTQALRVMFVTPEESAPRAYVDTVTSLRAGLTTMLLGIDEMLTPIQRLKAVATLQKLIDDVHGLRVG